MSDRLLGLPYLLVPAPIPCRNGRPDNEWLCRTAAVVATTVSGSTRIGSG